MTRYWKIIFPVLLVAATCELGTYSEKENGEAFTETTAIYDPPKLHFTIVHEEIYYSSKYAFAAIICMTSSDDQLPQSDLLDFNKPCQNSNESECLTFTGNNLTTHFQKIISKLGAEDVKPIVVDRIDLRLGSSPGGYRVMFKDFQVNGISNLTIKQIRTNMDNSLQFRLTFSIPNLSVSTLSKVLLMFAATGGGEYWSEFENIEVRLYIKAVEVERDSQTFLQLEDLDVDFDLEDVQMGVKNIKNKNIILETALNMFINAYALEFLKEIKPHIKSKLTAIVKKFVDNWFSMVPIDNSYLHCNLNAQ